MKYSIYRTDTATTLSGDDLDAQDWIKWDQAAKCDARKPLSYALWQAMRPPVALACELAREQGIEIVPYRGTFRDGQKVSIEDDGRITEAVNAVREAYGALLAKLSKQAPAPQYICAGSRDGCRTRVSVQGDYCDRCAFDNE